MSKQRGLSVEEYGYAGSVVIEYILENQRVDILDELGDDLFGDGFAEEIGYIRDFLIRHGILPSKKAFAVRFPDFIFFELKNDISDCVEILKNHRTFMLFYSMYDKIDKFVDNQNFDMAISTYFASLDKIAGSLNFESAKAGDRAGVKELYEQARKGNVYIPTGLEGFDDKFGGFNSRGDELSVLVARTGEGKTWLLLKMYLTALQNGYRAGFYSPEMSTKHIQMRLDTLLSKIPFRKVMEGNLDEGEYEAFKEVDEAWESVAGEGRLFDKKSFRSRLTVSDFDKVIRKYKLQILFIDGFKYINDIRSSSHAPLTEKMTNVAEDLVDLSARHGIPIICSIQSNRGGVEKGVPALENIKDSDGVSHNATNVFSMKNTYNKANLKTEIEFRVIKSRHSFIPDPFKYEARFGVGELEFKGCVEVGVKTVNKSAFNDNSDVLAIKKSTALNRKKDDEDGGGESF